MKRILILGEPSLLVDVIEDEIIVQFARYLKQDLLFEDEISFQVVVKKSPSLEDRYSRILTILSGSIGHMFKCEDTIFENLLSSFEDRIFYVTQYSNQEIEKIIREELGIKKFFKKTI